MKRTTIGLATLIASIGMIVIAIELQLGDVAAQNIINAITHAKEQIAPDPFYVNLLRIGILLFAASNLLAFWGIRKERNGALAIFSISALFMFGLNIWL